MDCVFCKIINGELPSYKVYEDEAALVFLNINPSSNGHMLIVPKDHYDNLVDIPLGLLNHINDVSKKMYDLIKKKLHADGLTISQNNDYGQEIKHYHMHLTPRYKNDNIEHVYNKDNLTSIEDVFYVLIK